MNEQDIEQIEAALGYTFKSRAHLQMALTHPSYRHECDPEGGDNQRLEFLGDAALGMITASHLFRRYPDMDEGALTLFRSRLTNRDILARIGVQLKLGEVLLLGRGEETSGGRERASNLTDAVEALLGAIYLDSGMRSVERVFKKLWADDLALNEPAHENGNPKGRLQEFCQSKWKVSPTYSIIEESGPPHARQYTSQVRISDKPYASGTGPNKRTAETAAAEATLGMLESE